MELTTEEFDYKAELAEIGKQISLARAELSDLEAKKSNFITEREALVVKAIKDAKKASFEALNAIVANQSELIACKGEVTTFVESIKAIKEKLLQEIEEYKVKNDEFTDEITKTRKEFEDVRREAKNQQDLLRADREILEGKRIELENRAKDVLRREKTIKRAIKEYGTTR